MTDYKQKYLDSFFKWQEAYGKAMQRIKELEEENERLKHEKEIRDNFSHKDVLLSKPKD